MNLRAWTGTRTEALIACGAGAALALAASLPAVRWEPLHVDEATTLEYATRPFTAIAHDTFVERGGGPLWFYLEYLTLQWPGGLEGLRVPSALFFAAALVPVWLVARDLADRVAATAVVLLLATAPLAVELGAFARPYSALLGFTALATWLSGRAARDPNRGKWIAAGVAAGALYLVHPIGPLYAFLAFATGPLVSARPLRHAFREAVPGAIAFGVLLAPYVWALAVLGRRYDVGTSGEGSKGRGLSVPGEALDALTPGGTPGMVVFGLAALAGLAVLGRYHPRTGIALVLWVTIPIAFFAFVPVGSTHFFGRYMLPALPFFLLLSVAWLALPQLGRLRAPLAISIVVGFLAWNAAGSIDGLRDAREQGLPALAAAVESVGEGPVVFGSTGSGSEGRPPELLDQYVILAVEDARLVDELPAVDARNAPDLVARGRAELERFLDGDRAEAVGVWIFASRRGEAVRLLVPGTRSWVVRDRHLVVATERPAPPADLVRAGLAVRQAWASAQGGGLVRTMIRVDRQVLGADD